MLVTFALPGNADPEALPLFISIPSASESYIFLLSLCPLRSLRLNHSDTTGIDITPGFWSRDTALPSPGHGTAVSLMDFGKITFMFAARDNDLGLLYSIEIGDNLEEVITNV